MKRIQGRRVAFIADTHLLQSNGARVDFYLESILNKMLWVVENHDVVIHLGDFFDQPSVSDYVKNYTIHRLSKQAKKFWVIPGNHDTPNWCLEPDVFFNTSLNTLYSLGFINELRDLRIEYKGKFLRVVHIPFDSLFELDSQDFPEEDYILVSHAYFDTPGEPYYLPKTLLEKLDNKPKLVLLGHVHFYKTYKVNGIPLIELDSLSRTRRIEYHYKNYPTILSCDIETGKFKRISLEGIALPPEQIFKDKQVKKEPVIIDMRKIVDALILKRENKLDFYEALEAVETPQHIMAYIKEKVNTIKV